MDRYLVALLRGASLKLASIDEANPNVTANEMLKSLTKGQNIIRDTLYKGLKVAQAEGDEGTADMIIGRIKVHEKTDGR